jgi:RNA polymerase sigma factor (sigma-70 family)
VPLDPPAEFGAFYRATVAPLRRYVARLLGGPTEAQDVAQDAYVRVYRAMREHNARCSQAYLYTTARNLAYNQLRRRRLEPMPETATSPIDAAPSPEPAVSQLVMARQEWSQLEAALQQLPAECRDVLILRRVEGLSHEEISRRLGVPRSTIEKRLARSVRLLRAAMRDEEGG